MLRCPELRKLAKAPRFSSILWKHQTPGSVAGILAFSNGGDILDPSHPAARIGMRGMPQSKRKELDVRMLPMALQERPQNVAYPFRRPILTWGERLQKAREAGVTAVKVNGQPRLVWKETGKPVGNVQVFPDDEDMSRFPECRATPQGPLIDVELRKMQRRVPMSYFTPTSKARMGSLRTTRSIIVMRVKAALNLIVSRGTYYGDISQKNNGNPSAISSRMRFDEEEAKSMGRAWVMQGWSYIFSPTLELYRMPRSTLIPILRKTLTTLNARALELENNWLASSLLNDQSQARYTPPKQTGIEKARRSSVTSAEERRSNYHPISPPSAPRARPAFDNASWKRGLEQQLRLLEQNSTISRNPRDSS